MADPTDPTQADPTIAAPTDDQLARWNTFEQVTAASGASLEKVGDVSSGVSAVFGILSDKLKMAGISFGDLSSMTDQTSRQFGMLTTSVLGAREAFTSIAGVDTSRLVTYMDQFKELGDILRTGPGTQMAANAIEAIIGKMSTLGATSTQVATAQKELKSGIMTTAAAFFTSADNVTRLQNSMMQMTTSGSGMDALLQAVGSDFQNLDKVTKDYSATLDKTSAALGGSKKAQELAASYMAVINKMPGGLSLLTKQTEIAGKSTNLLVESLNIAAISGRKEEEVLEDVGRVLTHYKSALDDSNAVGGAAATLQARMATIAGTLHANIQDVRGALMESTDAFKMFVMDGANAADMTKGMADAMQNYTSSLEAVGVPAANAIEMFKNYTGVMKNMNLGQQAFLSTMSGGPGGLRGAFKVQDQISKGDFEGLRKQVEGTIKKIGGGTIATKEQALGSEAGAAQYARQIQILQQGPLGSLAKSIPEAEAILKAMGEGKKLPTATTEKSPENKMQDAMKAGQKIQQDSYTELTKINTSLNSLVLRAGIANKETTREMLGTGNTGAYGGGVAGGGGGITPGKTGIGVPANDALQQVGQIAQQLPRTVKDAWESFKEAIGTGNKQSIQQANDKMVAAIKDQKAAQASLNEEQKRALATTEQAFSGMKPAAPGTGTVDKTPGRPGTQAASPLAPLATGLPRMNFTPVENYARPGQRIPAPLPPSNTTATGQTTAGRGGQQGGIGQGPTGQAVPVMLAPGSAITVNLTGVCPHCGRDINHTQTDKGVSQGANAP